MDTPQARFEYSEIDKAIIDAARAVASDHEEMCSCYQCEFAFIVFAQTSGISLPAGFRYEP